MTGEGWGRDGAAPKGREGVTWRDGEAAWREAVDSRWFSTAAATPFMDRMKDDFNCLNAVFITPPIVNSV